MYSLDLHVEQYQDTVCLGGGFGEGRMPTFLARDSMLSALYAIARPSVCLSVRHTGGSVENG